jgi:hypothetical protein
LGRKKDGHYCFGCGQYLTNEKLAGKAIVNTFARNVKNQEKKLKIKVSQIFFKSGAMYLNQMKILHSLPGIQRLGFRMELLMKNGMKLNNKKVIHMKIQCPLAYRMRLLINLEKQTTKIL